MITVEITAAIDAAGTLTTLYLADAALTTLPADSPANVSFDASLTDPGSVAITAFGDGRTSGGTRLALSEIKAANIDGQYDGWLNYGFDGRPVVIRRGEPGAYPGAMTTVFTGTIEALTVTRREVVLRVRDKQFILARPVLSSFYGGTNTLPTGVDGSDDLKGKPKPRLFGRCLNIPAPCVNTSKLIYQVSSGPVQAVDAVYDRGEALTNAGDVADAATLQTTTPAAGSYITCISSGLFRLGAAPAGLVTTDATQGSTPAQRTAGQIISALATSAGLSGSEVSSTDIAQLNADNPSTLGLWINDAGTTFAQALDRVTATVGAFYGFDATGVLRSAVLTIPSGAPALFLEEYDVQDPFERRPARDGDLPAWSFTVRHSRLWAVQEADVAAAVTPARRAALATEYGTARAQDATVKNQFLLAAEETVDSLFVFAAEATTEAARRLALYNVRRNFFDVTVNADLLFDSGARLLSLVQLTNPRFGLSAGGLFRLLGIRLDLARNRATLTLWG
jgi:hypothetical protein